MIALGIDIGGTSIKGAAVNENGKVFETFSMPVDVNDRQEMIIEKLAKCVKEYLSTYKFDEKIVGIGMGVPGSIDAINGVVTYSNNLYWKDLHIVDIMKKHFDLPIKITNDANAAAYGEAIFGAGKKYKDVIMLTLGTGVGGGIIINGKLYEGKNGKGAELGHAILVLDGEPCTCGRKGCIEAYASATALIRQTKQAMELDKSSLMWEEKEKYGKINGRVCFDAAKRGDKTAIKVVDQYVSYLGEAILNYCNIFRPDCFVLSGGIANQKEYLIDKLVKYCADREYGYPYSVPSEIKVAELGYESGIIGAACLILKK